MRPCQSQYMESIFRPKKRSHGIPLEWKNIYWSVEWNAISYSHKQDKTQLPGHRMVSTYLSTGDANDGGEGDIAAVLSVLKALIHRFLMLVAADVDADDDLRLEESP